MHEAIDVDFGALQKHGIFRDIPVQYGYDASHDRLYGFENASVVDGNGAPVTFKQSRNGANVRLQIGDANRTVSGKHSYRINYRIRDGLNAFPDHDELYWNVNGSAWQVPTSQVSALVTHRRRRYHAPSATRANRRDGVLQPPGRPEASRVRLNARLQALENS